MSDSNPWQSPSGPTPPAAPQPFGAPPPPASFDPPLPPFGAPPFGVALQIGAIPPPSWQPPPKPGLIPLAPMTLGTILGASFRVLRRNPRPIVGLSLIIHSVLALVGVIVTGNAVTTLVTGLNQLSSGTVATTGEAGNLLLADLSEFAVVALGLVGTQIMQGIITVEVTRGTVGERLPLRALWARARGRIGVLVGWALALVGSLIVFSVTVILVAALIAGLIAASSHGGASVGAAIGVVIALVVGGFVLALWLGIKLSLVPSILVVERLTLGKAMKRSWALTRSYFWRAFGIELLVWAMLAVAAQIVETPVTFIALIIGGIANPTGSSDAAVAATLRTALIASSVAGEIAAVITGIIQTASTALIYVDLRMRKEGLDLTLMKFVDARSAGDTSVPDPYLVVPPTPITPLT